MAVDLSLLDEDQRIAATAPRGPVCILAGAGTGKTRTITYRIAHMIDQGTVSPNLSLIHISEPTRREWLSRMPSSA